MFGGAYFRNFTVFKKKLVRKLQKETACIASVVSYKLSKKIDREAHSISSFHSSPILPSFVRRD